MIGHIRCRRDRAVQEVGYGPRRARELIFSGHVARMSPLAVASVKFVVNESIEAGLGVAAQLRLELARAARHNLTSSDAAQRLIAFSEQRTPKFQEW